MTRGPRRVTIFNDQKTGRKVYFRVDEGICKLVVMDTKHGVDVFRIQNSKIRKMLNWLAWLQRRE